MAQAPGALNNHVAAVPRRVNRVSLPFLRVQERRLLLSTVDVCIVAAIMTFAVQHLARRGPPGRRQHGTNAVGLGDRGRGGLALCLVAGG